MLGTRQDPKCKTKAAETWGLALFLIDELRTHRERLGVNGCRLLLAGEALEHLVVGFRECGWVAPLRVQEAGAHRNTHFR